MASHAQGKCSVPVVADDTHSEEQMAIFSCVDLGMNTCIRIAPQAACRSRRTA